MEAEQPERTVPAQVTTNAVATTRRRASRSVPDEEFIDPVRSTPRRQIRKTPGMSSPAPHVQCRRSRSPLVSQHDVPITPLPGPKVGVHAIPCKVLAYRRREKKPL